MRLSMHSEYMVQPCGVAATVDLGTCTTKGRFSDGDRTLAKVAMDAWFKWMRPWKKF